jgi:hypothetical protein
MDKIKLFAEVNDIVMDSIDEFWDGMDVDRDNLVITADQMVIIYLYVVIRSKVPCFFSHLKFIQEFTSQHVKLINYGFYMATYERALITLVDTDEQQLGMMIDLT